MAAVLYLHLAEGGQGLIDIQYLFHTAGGAKYPRQQWSGRLDYDKQLFLIQSANLDLSGRIPFYSSVLQAWQVQKFVGLKLQTTSQKGNQGGPSNLPWVFPKRQLVVPVQSVIEKRTADLHWSCNSYKQIQSTHGSLGWSEVCVLFIDWNHCTFVCWVP